MLKGKLIDSNGKVRFEGELTASDYTQINKEDGHQFVSTPVQLSLNSEPTEKKLPTASEVKLILEKLPPKQRTMAAVTQQYFGRLLTAKNRRVYGAVYGMFVRASRKLEREEKLGIIK